MGGKDGNSQSDWKFVVRFWSPINVRKVIAMKSYQHQTKNYRQVRDAKSWASVVSYRRAPDYLSNTKW